MTLMQVRRSGKGRAGEQAQLQQAHVGAVARLVEAQRDGGDHERARQGEPDERHAGRVLRRAQGRHRAPAAGFYTHGSRTSCQIKCTISFKSPVWPLSFYIAL